MRLALLDKKSRLLIIIIIALSYILLLYLFGINRPYWSDESHFVETIKYFYSHFEFNTLKDYPEVIPPLSFIIYTAWAKIFGIALPVLRLLSLIISFTTIIYLFKFFTLSVKNYYLILLSIFTIIVNPYFAGTSIFVYSDILNLFFLILVCLAVFKDSRFLLLTAFIFSLLTRQYSIFLLPPILIYYLFSFLIDKNNKSISMIIYGTISVIPLIILFIIWNGFAPKTGLGKWTIEKGLYFHINYFVAYIVMISVYSFPFIILNLRYFSKFKNILIISLLISFFYFIFPIGPSLVTVEQVNLSTIGYFHKFISSFLSDKLLVNIFFFFLFFVGLNILIYLVYNSYILFKSKTINFIFFLNLSIISFLIVMPFSYQVWEKYLLPILPLLILRLGVIFDNNTKLKLRDF